MSSPCLLYPVRFAAANPTIRVNTGAAQTITIPVAADTDYFLSGDGTATDLVDILVDALNTNSNAVVWSAVLSRRNMLVLTAGSSSSILWGDALTTIDETIFGFVASTTTGTTHTAPDQTQGIWIPDQPGERDVYPLDDTRAEPVHVASLVEAIDGSSRGYDFSSYTERRIDFHLIHRSKILVEYADATEPNGTLETAWAQWVTGSTIRYYIDSGSRGSYWTGRVRPQGRPWRRMDPSSPAGAQQRYTVNLELVEV